MLYTQVAYEELEIGEVIGKGSTGAVVEAVHKPTGTRLALKVRQKSMGTSLRRYVFLNTASICLIIARLRSSICLIRAEGVN